jgi:hypothetical protein
MERRPHVAALSSDLARDAIELAAADRDKSSHAGQNRQRRQAPPPCPAPQRPAVLHWR